MIYSSQGRITRALTAAFYLALILVLLVTTFYPAPVEGVSVILMLSVKLIPLLIFVVPVFRGNNRGYIWLSFVVIFYFTQAVVSAWLSEGAPVPVILSILSFCLFSIAMIHLKANRPKPAS
ncbi:DUF2069 domain-containing protein [Marinobacter salicampi]|uniref:DUF2069 domain-containing protein n=1 Tax=Marinobacter salicampi TaxID=435907 RepID=UPI0014080473|nr:DUF2069 domain-containing protein [Marinobacter salicampi]